MSKLHVFVVFLAFATAFGGLGCISQERRQASGSTGYAGQPCVPGVPTVAYAPTVSASPSYPGVVIQDVVAPPQTGVVQVPVVQLIPHQAVPGPSTSTQGASILMPTLGGVIKRRDTIQVQSQLVLCTATGEVVVASGAATTTLTNGQTVTSEGNVTASSTITTTPGGTCETPTTKPAPRP